MWAPSFSPSNLDFFSFKHLLGPVAFCVQISLLLPLLPDTCCLYCLSTYILQNSLKTSFCLFFPSGLLLSRKWFLLAKLVFWSTVMPLWCSVTPGNQSPRIPKTQYCLVCTLADPCMLMFSSILVLSLSYHAAHCWTAVPKWGSEFCSAIYSLSLYASH